VYKPARGGAVGEAHIAPQIFQHADEVRLAAAVEPADPHRRLLGARQVGQVGGEDQFQAAAVLTVADERAELVAQHLPLGRRARIEHLGHAVIGDARRGGVGHEDIAILHRPAASYSY